MSKKAIFFLLGLLAAVVLVNSVLSVYSLSTLDSRISAAIEEKKPASVELTLFLPRNCPECSGLDGFLTALSSDKSLINVTKTITVYLGSAQAAGLPSVKRLPAIVASGQVAKSEKVSSLFSSLGFSTGESQIVLETPLAPFFDIASGKALGLVGATAILAPNDCTTCVSGQKMLSDLELAGMYFSSKASLPYESAEGQALIARNEIKVLPAVVLSEDAGYYSKTLSDILSRMNSEGNYVIEATQPVYYDIALKRKRGEVSITFLNDSSCSTCSDVTYNLAILAGYGLVPQSQAVLDTSSDAGKALVAKYNITKVPTFVLEGDGTMYVGLIRVWPSVGTFETDGNMVFRSPDIMGPYVDLVTGKVVVPKA